MPVDQVQQGEQVDPDDVDEMPVQPADFERGVICGSEATLPCHPQQPCENAETDDHVESVQPGHYEIESEENLRVARIRILAGMAGDLFVREAECRAGNVVLVELVLVLLTLNAEEGDAEKHGQHEHEQEHAAARSLCGPYGENDG